MEQPRTLTLDGVSYDVAQFSQPVQQAVGIYNIFSADLQKAQLEVVKLQSAMQHISSQIGEAVKKELEEKKAAAEAAAAEVVAAEVVPE